MIEKKTLVTALSGVLIGGFLLSGGLAFAGDTKDSVTKNIADKMPFFGQMKHQGGMALGRGTQAQNQQRISDSLKVLVEKGTITQDQSAKILKQCEDAQKEQEDLFNKMESMTPEERRQYMQDNKAKPQNPLAQLVTDGVITQEQADAFQTTMREVAQKQNQLRITYSLQALVDKGTITQDQADKIMAKHDNLQKERESLSNKVKNMTPEERRQYMQENREKPQDFISQLVTDGTITQEQAEAIGGILPFNKGHRGGRR